MASFFDYPFTLPSTSWWEDPNLRLKVTEPLLVLSVLGYEFSNELYYWSGNSKKWPHESLGFQAESSQPSAQQTPNFPLMARTVICFSSC